MDEAVAITGLGMVTAQGVGVEATWRGVVAGREVLGVWAGVPEGHALAKVKVARCAGMEELPRPVDLPGRLWGRLSRTQQLACIAGDEAIGQAGLAGKFGETVGERVGLFLATTVCGMDVNERFYAQYRKDREGADMELFRRILPFETAALLGRRYGIGAGGLRSVCLSTCVGSAMAIGSAMDAINLGECALALAGGSEALCRVVLSGFHALKVAAAEGCRPFDKDRPGMTVGEGAGMLVLESVEHARRRGARVLGYLRGFGISCDAYHVTAPDPEGRQAARAMREALEGAGMGAAEVGYVNAHGTGTRDNDAMEARAIGEVFGKAGNGNIGETPMPRVAVSSTKRCTGHTFGAAGAIEAILCLKALEKGMAPANAGSVEGDGGLDVAVIRGGTMRGDFRAAMSTNFAFGGNNTALVFSREAGDLPRRHGGTEGWDRLAVLGMGVVTDGYEDIGELVEGCEGVGAVARGMVARARRIDAVEVESLDMLARLGMGAVEQAWTMGRMGEMAGERVGMIFVTAWGAMDATTDYLESMLEAEGRYASPRHFSRSVYSSAASALAIRYGIRGPCETLTFDEDAERGRGAVAGALLQARRFLEAGRCERVVLVWADQSCEVAEDLVRRAAEKLHRWECERYLEKGLGQGAVAVVVGKAESGGIEIELQVERWRMEKGPRRGRAYPMDAAVSFLESVVGEAAVA